MRILPLLALMACATTDSEHTAAELPVEQAAPPVVLTVEPAIIPGERVTFTVTGAAPNDLILVARGTDLGAGGCPPVFQGACLGITRAQPLTTGLADANGDWSWTVRAPDFLVPGTPISFQAFAVGAAGVASDPIAAVVAATEEGDCTDNIDADQDGLVDCADSDCAAVPACSDCAPGADTIALGDQVLDGFDLADDLDSLGRRFDSYLIAGVAGESIIVDIDGSAGGGLDLVLEDDSCNELGTVEGGEDLVTRITFPADGLYTLKVRDRLPVSSTTYVLSIEDDRALCTTLGFCCFGDALTLGTPGIYEGELSSFDAIGGPAGSAYIFDDVEFEATAGDPLVIEVVGVTDGRIHLLDDTCRPIAASTVNQGQAQISTTAARDGIYTVAVSSLTETPFELRVSDGQGPLACERDALEPNNTSFNATPLSEGITEAVACLTNEDWFEFDMVAGEVLDLVVRPVNTTGNTAHLMVQDPVGNSLYDFDIFSSGTVNRVATVSGTYLVNVYGIEDDYFGGGIPYSIEFERRTLEVCLDDALETNDTFATATPIQLGDSIDATACETDTDFFVLDLPGGATSIIEASEESFNEGTQVELYDATGAVIPDTYITNSKRQYTPIGDEVVYVGVEVAYDDLEVGGGVAYTLTSSIVNPCIIDAYEPDDTVASASFLLPGSYDLSLCDSSDDDYFLVDLLAGQTLTVDLSFSDAEGDIDIQILDAAGNQLDSSAGTLDTEFVTWAAITDETVTVRVYLYRDDGSSVAGNTYQLDLDIQ